jgi:hypothetical protein
MGCANQSGLGDYLPPVETPKRKRFLPRQRSITNRRKEPLIITQSTDSGTENPSDENGSTAYAELLGTSVLEQLKEKPWEVKLALLQHHLGLGRLFVGELLKEEVEEKAGKRYSRWSKNPGSVRIGEEKVLITIPCMTDTETGETCSPERYHELEKLPEMARKMQEAILLGLSQNDYERVASRALSEARK